MRARIAHLKDMVAAFADNEEDQLQGMINFCLTTLTVNSKTMIVFALDLQPRSIQSCFPHHSHVAATKLEKTGAGNLPVVVVIQTI